MIQFNFNVFWEIIAGVSIGLLSSFLGVRIGLWKYRQEIWWEHKTKAYLQIIEATHNVKISIDIFLRSEYGENISDKTKDKYNEVMSSSFSEIRKLIDMGFLYLSKDAIVILNNYMKSNDYDPESLSFSDYLEGDLEITNKFLINFIAIAKKDLKIK